MVEALGEALGTAAELPALLAADNAAPRVMLVARPGLSTVDELVAAGGVRGTLSPYAVELAGGDPSAVPAVAEGRAGVQDEGSQLVALALAEAELDGRDERWLDVCSGPGGKAALLAALAAQRGARGAGQRASSTTEPGWSRAAPGPPRSGLSGVVTGDGTRPPWREGTFDRVLVDAPCSGLGALRRRPESRWRRTPQDLDVLVPLQRDLLDAAITSTRPGGVVVYATCSPVLAETTGVVEAVLAGRDDAAVESTRQLWPHRDGTDAMFIATIRRAEPDPDCSPYLHCGFPPGRNLWMMMCGGPIEVIGRRGIESVSATSTTSRSRGRGPALATVRCRAAQADDAVVTTMTGPGSATRRDVPDVRRLRRDRRRRRAPRRRGSTADPTSRRSVVRSFGLVPSGTGTASGPTISFLSLAALGAGVDVRAESGTTGASYIWVTALDAPAGYAWRGRAALTVSPATWQHVDTATLPHEWQLVDLTTGLTMAVEAGTPAEFAARHGDGAGYVVTGFGCDGRPSTSTP